ncbi:hypothetical protein M8C21_011874 [Ambrosia artemisiifolia]|uniref:CRM domain-containing protein n=1 Tax=Ambrosia artemisiifolia TaxID=4212 RepID=A0AAD5C9H8_AMBAR|nr:hypothetical protein M8C21_011874 [Ambrosia artemisiifolia]
MLLKLISRQRHHHKPPPTTTTTTLFSRHLTQTHFEPDPPFTPIPKPTQNKQTHKPITITNKQPNNNTFPIKSNLPFDFKYSYSETNPSVHPIGFRETPKFSPFGPGRLDRKWTGTEALLQQDVDIEKVDQERNNILGEPLDEDEVLDLVERYRHGDCSRQINLGKGGVTHNMIDDIHNHWKKAEAVRIKCLGVPTLDMDNVCFHLEDKSGGKIIYRQINILLLYRGRNYDPKTRPVIPLMLWKPYPPIYPKLIKNVADGLTFEETKEMRNRGLNSPPIIKLTRNGVYVNVVEKVREAFETKEVLRIDCVHVGMSDCKRIAVKLRDLVPCVPILYKDEQIIIWRGKKTM